MNGLVRARLTAKACGWNAAVALALAGCGSSRELPPSPEPAVAPRAAEKPAGRVVRVGPMPEGAVLDPVSGLLAVALRSPGGLALVDARSGRVVRRVRLPGAARHLQLERPGGPVLAPLEDADVLARVSLPQGRVIDTVRVRRQPHDATATAGRIFVGDELGDTVSVIAGGRVVRTLPAPVHPGGLAVPRPDRVGVVAVKERKLALYDARGLRELHRVDAGVGPTHVVSDGRGRLFVVDTEGDAILVFRAGRKLELICRTNVAGRPYGIAIDVRRRRLWVTTTASNRLVELALRGDEPPLTVTSHPTVRQANTIAVDPRNGRVFVTGRDGMLQIFQPPR